MASESHTAKAKWSTVETGGKLYLYAEHTIDEYQAAQGYVSSREVGRPMSKQDCLRLARTLLNHATR